MQKPKGCRESQGRRRHLRLRSEQSAALSTLEPDPGYAGVGSGFTGWKNIPAATWNQTPLRRERRFFFLSCSAAARLLIGRYTKYGSKNQPHPFENALRGGHHGCTGTDSELSEVL